MHKNTFSSVLHIVCFAWSTLKSVVKRSLIYPFLFKNRASLGWFAHTPEWFDLNNNNFNQSEAQSISIFVHHLLNDRSDTPQLDLRARGLETGSSLNDVSKLDIRS